MGRLSQLFWFMNADKMPTKQEQQHHYSHLDVTDEVKAIRKEHKAQKRRESKALGVSIDDLIKEVKHG